MIWTIVVRNTPAVPYHADFLICDPVGIIRLPQTCWLISSLLTRRS